MTPRLLTTITLLWTCLIGSLGVSASAHADMAVIVNAKNPLKSLNEDEVRQIFLGRMRLFPGTRTNVDPVDQDASAPGFIHFYRHVANLTPMALQRLRAMYLFSGKGLLPKIQASEAEVVAFVAKNPNAIGYVHKEHLTPEVKSVLVIRE